MDLDREEKLCLKPFAYRPKREKRLTRDSVKGTSKNMLEVLGRRERSGAAVDQPCEKIMTATV